MIKLILLALNLFIIVSIPLQVSLIQEEILDHSNEYEENITEILNETPEGSTETPTETSIKNDYGVYFNQEREIMSIKRLLKTVMDSAMISHANGWLHGSVEDSLNEIELIRKPTRESLNKFDVLTLEAIEETIREVGLHRSNTQPVENLIRIIMNKLLAKISNLSNN